MKNAKSMSSFNQEKQRIVEEFDKVAEFIWGLSPWNRDRGTKAVKDFIVQSLDTLHAAVMREVGEKVEGLRGWRRPPSGNNPREIGDTSEGSRYVRVADVLAILSAPNKDKEE